MVNLDKTARYQVTSACEEPYNMVQKSWFLLPPLEEYYYRPKHPDYFLPPQYRADCKQTEGKVNPMQMIYPKSLTKIYLPVDFNGLSNNVVFRVAHRQSDATIYWHLDSEYVGHTKSFHQMSLIPQIGKHRLTLIDEQGNRLEQLFERIDKK